MKSFALLFFTVISFSAVAATPKWDGPEYEGTTLKKKSALTAAEFKAESLKASKRGERGLAQNANYENQLSPKMKNLRKELLSVKNHLELDEKVEALAKSMDAVDAEFVKTKVTPRNPYNGEDKDYIYFASQMVPLRCMKGFTFKFTPLAESSGVVDTVLISNMRALATSMQIFMPESGDIPNQTARAAQAADQNISRSVFDYMTKPYDQVVLFTSGSELQAHFMNTCLKELEKSANRIEALDLNQPVVWDNKLYFGIGTFPEDLDRYKLIGEAERHFSLAMKYAGMHFIKAFRSYSIKNFFPLQTELARLIVNDAGFFDRGFRAREGVNLEKRKEVLLRAGKETFLRYSDGATHMASAFDNLQRSVQELKLTWDEVKDRGDSPFRVLNPAFFNGFQRGIGATLDTWLRLTSGPAELKSRVTGRVITVNLKGFYTDPPADLKSLLPKTFAHDPKQGTFIPHPHKTFITDATTKRLVPAPAQYAAYRNYYDGTPDTWDMGQWGKLIVGTKNETFESDLRTLQQAWGGSLVALPFLNFLR